MKVIIAGGRSYKFTALDRSRINGLKLVLPITEVVSGCASGADQEGELWAKSAGIPIKHFPANWSKYGKSAGPIRNREMANYADAVILFKGGSGTKNMLEEARAKGLKIYNFTEQELTPPQPKGNHD